MAKLNRGGTIPTANYSIGLNVVVAGSKKMGADVQDQVMENEPDAVRVLIVDANDSSKVLVDVIRPAEVFATGSIGYKFHSRGHKFFETE